MPLNSFSWLMISVMLLFTAIAKGQGRHTLSIGDTIPDWELKNVSNYRSDKLNIGQLGDKILIFDFWATWCVPCVASFPKMDSIQKKYDDKVLIVAVSGENPEKVDRFLKRILLHNDFKIPFSADQRVAEAFSDSSDRFVASCVWIKDGIIRAITPSTEVNGSNIQKILHNQSINSKASFISSQFNDGHTADSSSAKPKPIYESAITHYVKGTDPRFISRITLPDSLNHFGEVTIQNYPIAFLFQKAHSMPLAGRTIFRINNVDEVDPPYSKWDSTNLYSYRLKTPASSSEELLSIMKSDIERAFLLKAKIKRVRVSCLVLKNGNGFPKTTGGEPATESSNYFIHLNNQPVDRLVNLLEKYLFSREISFIKNEINVAENIDIDIDTDLTQLHLVAEALKQRGFELSWKKRRLKMLVITKDNAFQ